jgi:hypothetical protein
VDVWMCGCVTIPVGVTVIGMVPISGVTILYTGRLEYRLCHSVYACLSVYQLFICWTRLGHAVSKWCRYPYACIQRGIHTQERMYTTAPQNYRREISSAEFEWDGKI